MTTDRPESMKATSLPQADSPLVLQRSFFAWTRMAILLLPAALRLESKSGEPPLHPLIEHSPNNRTIPQDLPNPQMPQQDDLAV